MSKALYAVYRGDEFIDVGTADELAERRGVKADTIRFQASSLQHRRQIGGTKIYSLENYQAYEFEGVNDEKPA